MTTNDGVNHPSHYTQGEIECIDAIRAALTPDEFRGYCKGNAFKYIWRERHKGGQQDADKAAWYLAYLRGYDGVQFRHGDIDRVCGIRCAGEFTQPPNCSLGVSKPTPPMHAVALEMAEAATKKRRAESDWSVTWPHEPRPEYQTLVGN